MTDNLINYSEFAALASCEWKWMYGYLLHEEETGPRRGLHLGTLLHLGADRWLRGEGATLPTVWTDDINTGGKPGEQRTLELTSFESELVTRATWLLGRFAAVYGEQPPSSWNVISSEEWLTGEVAGVRIVGRTDGLVEIDGKLWLREVKSAANIKQRLLTTNVEPQPGVYFELVKAKYGEYPFGIMYEGIHTYQWKPTRRTLAEIEDEIGPRHEGSKKDLRIVAKRIQENEPGVERPAEDSFQREWLDRSPEQQDITMAYLDAAIYRRNQLIPRIMPSPPELALHVAIPNIGHGCNSCGFKPRCWAQLTGEDFDDAIEVEDEEELDWGSDG